jgi:hypothetical protein
VSESKMTQHGSTMPIAEVLAVLDAAIDEADSVSVMPLTKARAAVAALVAENARLREALINERRVRTLGQLPDIHRESLRDARRACYAATDAALSGAGHE